MHTVGHVPTFLTHTGHCANVGLRLEIPGQRLIRICITSRVSRADDYGQQYCYTNTLLV